MIYFIGMSHMLAALNAASINGLEEQLPKIDNANEPVFVDWQTRPGVLPQSLMAASIYIGNTVRHWGQVMARQLDPGKIGIAPGFQKMLESIDGASVGNTLFAFIHGEENITLSLAEHPVPYDFHLPWREDLPILSGRQILPLEIVEKHVAYVVDDAIAILNAIRVVHPRLRIVNVVCPPVVPIELITRVECGPDEKPPEVINPNSVRLKYYLLYVKAMQDALTPRGIETLMPPPETVDENGYFRAEYIHDPLHGNALYGSRVLRQITGLLKPGAH